MLFFYALPHSSGWVLWFQVGVPLSAVHPYFCFWMITCEYINGFSPNYVCICIMEIWFGIANGHIFRQFLTVIFQPQDSGGVVLFLIFIFFVVVGNHKEYLALCLYKEFTCSINCLQIV